MPLVIDNLNDPQGQGCKIDLFLTSSVCVPLWLTIQEQNPTKKQIW